MKRSGWAWLKSEDAARAETPAPKRYDVERYVDLTLLGMGLRVCVVFAAAGFVANFVARHVLAPLHGVQP